MLVRSDSLQRAGGIAAVRGAVIDDCALGAALKRVGPVWLGLTAATGSFRPYRRLGEIWNMVARTAYAQLRCSPVILAVAVAGLVVAYAAPPLLLIGWPLHGDSAAALMGAAAWILMTVTYAPILRLYRRPARIGVTLPLAAVLYLAMTVDSAVRHWRGVGATWKGRAGAGLAGPANGGTGAGVSHHGGSGR